MYKTFQFQVKGLVQGVGFRYFTQSVARNKKLDGFVQNEQDGSVTGVIAGEEHLLEEFFVQLGQGPRLSRVDSLEVEELQNHEFRGFEVRR